MMSSLCIGQLAQITGGRLRLASMPPLAGDFEPVRRIVIDSRDAGPGSVFWGLQGSNYEGRYWAEDAFSRGALGAVVANRRLEPWAGKFAVEIQDPNRALCRLTRHLARARGGSWLYATTVDPEQLWQALSREELTSLEEITQQLARRTYPLVVPQNTGSSTAAVS